MVGNPGPGDPIPSFNASAVGLKLLSLLLVLAGVSALVLAGLVSRLPTASHDGVVDYVVPGSHGRSLLGAGVVSVLAGAGLVFAALGCCGLSLVRFVARRPARTPSPVAQRIAPPRRRSPRLVLGLGLCLLAAVAMFRWYAFVTNTGSPINMTGVWLNAHMPEPLRRWGCLRLKATFGSAALPPAGCESADDPSLWR